MTARRSWTHKVAVAVAVTALLGAACARSGEGAGKNDSTPADKLAEMVAEQRAMPVQRPAVADRDDVRPVLTERWRWRTPDGGHVGLPASDDRGLVTTHTERFLVALGASGGLQWSTEHPGLRPVEPLLAGEVVVAAAEDDVIAVDRATGARRWAVTIGHERANAPALAGDDTVVVSTWEGRLLALDLVTGAVRWSRTLAGPSLWRPAATGAHVVAAWDGGWGGFAVADGSVLWSDELYPDGIAAPVVATPGNGGAVAVVTSGGRIDANELASGEARWRSTIWVDSAIDQGIAAVPRPRGGPAVAVPDRDGGLTVLDAGTGDVQWFRQGAPGDQAERGTPAALADGLAAYALDIGGLRVAWAGGHRDVELDGPVAGVTSLGAGVVVTTWHTEAPAVVAFDVLTRAPSG